MENRGRTVFKAIISGAVDAKIRPERTDGTVKAFRTATRPPGPSAHRLLLTILAGLTAAGDPAR